MNVRKTVATAAIGLGVLAGSAGLASAVTSSPSTSQQTANPTVEVDQKQDPLLNGSVQAAENESLSETDEAASLATLATINSDAASAAAVAANPGATVVAVQLGNENGSVVYDVEMTDASGTAIEVKVDAGNGAILAQESGSDHEDANDANDVEGAHGETKDDAGGTAEVTPGR